VALNELLPSPLAFEAAQALGELASGATENRTGDERWQPPGLWRALAAGDWTTLADGPTPGADGELGLLDLCTVAEAWGRALVGLPLVGTLAARRWLAERPDADVAMTVPVEEFGSRVVITHPQQVTMVLDGDAAVPVGQLGDVDAWCPTLPLATASATFTVPGPAALDAAVLWMAETVGVADRALQEAVEYAKVRKQFGQPIGAFQAVKHRLADMHCNVELARSGVAWYCSEPRSMPGTVGTVLQMCSTVVEGAIQVFGGIGYTWECDLHFALRHVAQSHRLITALVDSAGLPLPALVTVG
jgi:alkylation response protein AidB-like acyl-CoA dehydrogenase